MSDDPFVTKLGLTPPQAAILNRLADATAPTREYRETRDGVERVYLRFVHNDGGRSAAGYKGTTGDCGVRALAVAVFGAKPAWQGIEHAGAAAAYEQARELVLRHAKRERLTKQRPTRSSVGSGIRRPTMHRIMVELGWRWRATMAIGGGCTTHLRSDELPDGRLILNLSKHYCAMIDGVVHDNHCDDRDGTRCVYSYWYQEGK